VTPFRNHITAQRGTAMVEFALVLPILLFLALGIVDFGRAINYWNDVNQIAGEGARFAAVNNNPGTNASPAVADFRQWLRGQADTGELKDGSQSVSSPLKVCVESPNSQPLTVGNPIRVRVESSYNLIPFLGQKTQAGSVNIKGAAVMRLERNYTGATGCTA
jgi:Flp pilus assembly protein TadG